MEKLISLLADETKVEILEVYLVEYEIKAQIRVLMSVRKQGDDKIIKSQPQPEELDFRLARLISLISNVGTMKTNDQMEALGSSILSFDYFVPLFYL